MRKRKPREELPEKPGPRFKEGTFLRCLINSDARTTAKERVKIAKGDMFEVVVNYAWGREVTVHMRTPGGSLSGKTIMVPEWCVAQYFERTDKDGKRLSGLSPVSLRLALNVLDSFKKAGSIFDDYQEWDEEHGFVWGAEEYDAMLKELRELAQASGVRED
jgi:hypothetical protein